MARLNLGDTSFPARFSYLSSKQDLPTFDLLTDLIVGSNRKELDGNIYVTRGFVASVINDADETNGMYILLGTGDYTDINNWIAVGNGGSSLLNTTDDFVLTGTDITNGYVDLSQIPNQDKLIVLTIQGLINYDYTITTNRLTFGPSLNLEVGDEIDVTYYY